MSRRRVWSILGSIGIGLLACARYADEPPGPEWGGPIYADLGVFDMVRLGTPPIAGTVTLVDVNDSNEVVGRIDTRPFRWKNGTWTLLSVRSATAGATIYSINNRGVAVGLIGKYMVVWPAGDTTAVDAMPQDTLRLWISASNITDAGEVVLNRLSSFDGGSYMVASTNTHTATGPVNGLVSVVAMNERRTFLGLWWPRHTAVIERAVGTGDYSKCGRRVDGDHDEPRALNDRDDYIVAGSPTPAFVNGGTATFVYFAGAECVDLTAYMPEAWLINNLRWVAGGTDIMVNHYIASIDSLLHTSPAGAGWRVEKLNGLNNRGALLLMAAVPGSPKEPVLLVPRKRFSP